MSAPSSGIIKLLLVVLIASLGILAVINYNKRVEIAKEQLTLTPEQTQTESTEKNKEAAKKIVDQLKKHMEIDTSIEPTVAQIIDVKALQKQNSFYNSAKNGDYLIVTSNRAIIFDPAKDVVIDVVPVQIQSQTAPVESSAASAAPGKKAASSSAAAQ